MSTKSRSLDAVDEKVEASTSASEVPAETLYRPEIDTSGVDERKLLRRIDWHVVPWLAVLYLLNFLDRGNIGNARVSRCSLTGGRTPSHRKNVLVQLYHMQTDINITDKQYLIALTVFFFPYALFEVCYLYWQARDSAHVSRVATK